MSEFKILLVDDEPEYLEVIQLILETEGYTIATANSGAMALEKLKSDSFNLVLTDLIMPKMTGVELLETIKIDMPHIEVIIFTGYGSVASAVEAMKLGAFNYFIKSHDPACLIEEIEKVKRLVTYTKSDHQYPYILESQSPAFSKVLKTLEKAAKADVNVLLLGESGVGKEVLANYIHLNSKRTEGAFVPVNCHAFSDSLLESELFGHEKGSFTGAVDLRIGRFEAADNGTLFLDEIGDTALTTQVKLLRALESKCIERLGSNQCIYSDFRLIAATNRPIETLIETGEFREDLYYRISTIAVTVPPLRNRREDLPILIKHFFDQAKVLIQQEIMDIEEEVITALIHYDYPGNIRELKNIIERLVVLSDHGRITLEDLPEHFRIEKSVSGTLKDFRAQTEREFIIKALEKNNYHMTQTAEKLGISRRQLFNKIDQYNIEK